MEYSPASGAPTPSVVTSSVAMKPQTGPAHRLRAPGSRIRNRLITPRGQDDHHDGQPQRHRVGPVEQEDAEGNRRQSGDDEGP